MSAWIELRHRLKKLKLLIKFLKNNLRKKQNIGKNVLIRIIAVVKYLAKHNLAFRGTHENLYEIVMAFFQD